MDPTSGSWSRPAAAPDPGVPLRAAEALLPSMGVQREVRINQFARPDGFLGRVAGFLMAVGNADMERKAVGALSLSAGESVLEIGFGPGVGLRLLCRRVPRGLVAGIDPSQVMIKQASRRNRDAIRRGQVELRSGTASDLPWPSDRFDAAVSVNNIQEWPSLRDDLAELWRVLRPGGCLVVAVHAFLAKSAQDRGNPERPWEEHIVGALRGAGFSDVAGWKGRALSGRALYFRARKHSAA